MKKAHVDENGCFYLPSDTIEGAVREASKNFKNGRGSYKKLVQASVFCTEEKLYLKYGSHGVDSRFSVHPSTRNGVMTNRMRFDNWTLTFTLEFDASRIDAETLKDILTEAGSMIGVCSYRPKFGRFKVTEYKVKQ